MRSTNLSDEIARELRRRIARGSIPRGERINESELSVDLEVSRTPLREALSRLAAEGFVTSHARRGYFVQELGPGEIRSLYQIRAILDPAALELAGLPPAAALDRLADLGRRMREAAAAADPEAVIELDDAWHRTLLAHCPNPILLGLIRRFMLRTRPLERAYMSERANVEAAAREHDRILEALERGELDRAVEALRENMSTATGVLAGPASARPPGEEGE